MVVIDGSSHMVAGSALYRVSLVVRADDHYAVEQTYLLGLVHIGFADDAQVGSHSVPPVPALVGNRCTDRSSRPWL